MISFDVQRLFTTLAQFPGLQRKEWERNQSGADRGMESVLIQRSPREVATYALVRLRFFAMPQLWAACREVNWVVDEARSLTQWARTQGHGGSMLAKVVQKELGHATPTPKTVAALASLNYYHCREADSPAVKSSWTTQGFETLTTLDIHPLLEYPTFGDFWHKKFETALRLVGHVRHRDFSDKNNETVVQSLQSIPGVGPQTASMTALFWLGRAVPILDQYLLRLLRQHHLLPSSFTLNARNRADLSNHLLAGARQIAATRQDWSSNRVLACLYLWICEVGRFHCRCQNGDSSTCPLRDLNS